MRKINIFLFSFLLLTITGCEDKKTDMSTTFVENTTQVLPFSQKEEQKDTRFNIHKPKRENTTNKSNKVDAFFDTFTLSDRQETRYTVDVANKKVTFTTNVKEIVLVTFFSTWCSPCLADIPYMNDLHKEYEKELLIAGVLVHDAIDKDALNVFLAKHDVRYFVSTGTQNNDFASLVVKTLHLPKDFSIPLTVMYVKGEYFTHYEGCVPIEMIDYDIQQALKTLN